MELTNDDMTWPFSFAAIPWHKPKVIKVVTLEYPPTAVIASRATGNKEKWCAVATLEGRLHVYGLGRLGEKRRASRKDIKRKGAINIGRNATCLNYQKLNGVGNVLVVSRGDREIEWVEVTQDNARVRKVMRDTRLVDPVWAQQADTNNGAHPPIITVCDFGGKQIINYRYGEFTISGDARKTVYGMGPEGKDAFECQGILKLPGKPFKICAGNVP